MTQPNKRTVFIATIIGNILDHYDVALYAFLAPFLAPVFFAQSDPIVALILTYGLMSINAITRPIGSLFFGKMAITHGAKRTLIITLLGVTITTFCLGIIPEYSKIGFFAPVLLCITRMIQGLFAAGEISVSSLFILEQCQKENHAKASSYYLCSTMFGITLASWAAAIVSNTSDPQYYWRYAFFASVFTGIAGLWLRMLLSDTEEKQEAQKHNIGTVVLTNKLQILRIMLVSSFSFMTYSVPFIFLNKFIPVLRPITDTEMLMHNSVLLTIDIILLPIFGYIASKFEYSKWMASVAFTMTMTIVPIFYLMQFASLMEITLMKLWIIVLGVAFSAPLNAWFFETLATRDKYTIMGFGYSIGTEVLGRNTTVICWSLWYYFQNVMAPALYITMVSVLALVALVASARKNVGGGVVIANDQGECGDPV